MYRTEPNDSQVLKTHTFVFLMYILDAQSKEENKKVPEVGSYYHPGTNLRNYSFPGAPPPPPHSQEYPFSEMSIRPNLGEKSIEQNRKDPEIESYYNSGIHSSPSPPLPLFSSMPFPALSLLGIPSPSPINATFSPTSGIPMSSVFSKVSTPPSIIATSPDGKDATENLNPTKIKVILLISVEISRDSS